MRKFPVILFFIASTVPTAEDFAEAGTLGPNVKFRNASMIPAEGCLEKCDGVAGQVPERYAEAYPTAEEANAAFAEAVAAGQDETPAKAKAKATAAKPAKAPATPKPAASAPVWKPNTPTGN